MLDQGLESTQRPLLAADDASLVGSLLYGQELMAYAHRHVPKGEIGWWLKVSESEGSICLMSPCSVIFVMLYAFRSHILVLWL